MKHAARSADGLRIHQLSVTREATSRVSVNCFGANEFGYVKPHSVRGWRAVGYVAASRVDVGVNRSQERKQCREVLREILLLRVSDEEMQRFATQTAETADRSGEMDVRCNRVYLANL